MFAGVQNAGSGPNSPALKAILMFKNDQGYGQTFFEIFHRTCLTKMKITSAVALLAVILLIPSCYGSLLCGDDPAYQSIDVLAFSLTEVDSNVFKNDKPGRSLEITNMDNGQTPFFKPVYRMLDGDTTGLTFSIDDQSNDIKAREALTCGTYVLKYRINHTDTLKICYRLGYDKRCPDNQDIKEMEVYWNGVTVDDVFGYRPLIVSN